MFPESLSLNTWPIYIQEDTSFLFAILKPVNKIPPQVRKESNSQTFGSHDTNIPPEVPT
jgi:hypothetical protein